MFVAVSAAVFVHVFRFFPPLCAELNERCLSEANSAFGDIHPAIARVYDQKGQILLSLKDLDGAAKWFSESRQVFCMFFFPVAW